MDTLNEEEAKIMAEIAGSSDHQLLMMNLNRYKPGNFPDGTLYHEWRKINAEMIGNVGGKILWTLPVKGHILTNGPEEPLDEILAYWYPSHQSFLDMREFEITKRNFEIRKRLIDYAIVHRCNGGNPPLLSS
jgi:hypothetical protein